MACGSYSAVISTFEKNVENLKAFSEGSDSKIQDAFKSGAKTFYDSIQQKCYSEEMCQNLPPLVIENFDDEQIWQQFEQRKAPATAYLHKYFKTSGDFTFGVKNFRSQKFNTSVDPHVPMHSEGDSFHESGDFTFGVKNFRSQKLNTSVDPDVHMDSEGDSDSSFDESDSDDNSDKNDFDEHSEMETQKPLNKHRKFNSSSSAVDDKFFKISQLEEFLKYSDLKEERGEDDVSSDESDIDLFADIPSDDEAIDDDDEDSNEESAKKQKSAREVMYKEFFDPPEDEEDEPFTDHISDISDSFKEFANRKVDTIGKEKKTVRFTEDVKNDKNLQLFEDSDDDSILSENSEYEKQGGKTPFERQQERERKQIQKLEESLLKEKPWQLTGEVAGDSRPQDSLLHENFEFDSNLKPDLVSTDELTERVEAIIIKAIENKAWCDVEIKERPVEDAFRYKYTEPLNQAKSAKSLAEVYEEEYKKKHEDEPEKEDPRHTEIKKLMDSVATTLANLFSHAPRPPVPEIKVVNNMPAITLEEVAPIGVSDATLLAPEEIKNASGLPIGKSERTDTDKKRERRKKKKLQKIRSLEKEEREKKKAAVSEKAASKFAKQQALKKLSQQKNVTIVDDKKRKRKRT